MLGECTVVWAITLLLAIVNQDLAEINKEKRTKDSIVEEKKKFLEGEIENNTEEERRLSQKIRQVLKSAGSFNKISLNYHTDIGGKISVGIPGSGEC